MPSIVSSSKAEGKDNANFAAVAAISSNTSMQNPVVNSAFMGHASLASKPQCDFYRYRNFEAKPLVRFNVDVYDAFGRLKWKGDPDGR